MQKSGTKTNSPTIKLLIACFTQFFSLQPYGAAGFLQAGMWTLGSEGPATLSDSVTVIVFLIDDVNTYASFWYNFIFVGSYIYKRWLKSYQLSIARITAIKAYLVSKRKFYRKKFEILISD